MDLRSVECCATSRAELAKSRLGASRGTISITMYLLCMFVCMLVTYIHIYVYVCIYVCICICISLSIHIYIYIHMYMYAHKLQISCIQSRHVSGHVLHRISCLASLCHVFSRCVVSCHAATICCAMQCYAMTCHAMN